MYIKHLRDLFQCSKFFRVYLPPHGKKLDRMRRQRGASTQNKKVTENPLYPKKVGTLEQPHIFYSLLLLLYYKFFFFSLLSHLAKSSTYSTYPVAPYTINVSTFPTLSEPEYNFENWNIWNKFAPTWNNSETATQKVYNYLFIRFDLVQET